MFKFDFFNNENAQIDQATEEITWIPAKEIKIKDFTVVKEIFDKIEEKHNFKHNETTLHHLPTTAIITLLKEKNLYESTVLKADEGDSDLFSGVYEGGFKIWECTYDLIKYVISNIKSFDNKRVLDLGCGVGLIGTFCLLNQGNVCFQDYNEEVLQYITIPTLILNLNGDCDDDRLKNCSFFSGDWKSFADIYKSVKFDYIFTSETIYNRENYEKLHFVFERCLTAQGSIYLAAKTCYFGVGGGLRSFEEFVARKGVFDSTVCWTCKEGVQREILQLTFKNI